MPRPVARNITPCVPRGRIALDPRAAVLALLTSTLARRTQADSRRDSTAFGPLSGASTLLSACARSAARVDLLLRVDGGFPNHYVRRATAIGCQHETCGPSSMRIPIMGGMRSACGLSTADSQFTSVLLCSAAQGFRMRAQTLHPGRCGFIRISTVHPCRAHARSQPLSWPRGCIALWRRRPGLVAIRRSVLQLAAWINGPRGASNHTAHVDCKVS